MHALYECVDGGQTYESRREVKLPKHLADRIEEAYRQGEPHPERVPWEISGAELRCKLLDRMELPNASRFKLVVDLKPSAAKEAMLLEICHVWGISDPRWTPLMLRLRVIFEPDDEKEIATFRQQPNRFVACPGDDFVYEFLMLQWGFQGGRARNWGRIGYVNGTLLWPPHLRYFLRFLNQDDRLRTAQQPPALPGGRLS